MFALKSEYSHNSRWAYAEHGTSTDAFLYRAGVLRGGSVSRVTASSRLDRVRFSGGRASLLCGDLCFRAPQQASGETFDVYAEPGRREAVCTVSHYCCFAFRSVVAFLHRSPPCIPAASRHFTHHLCHWRRDLAHRVAPCKAKGLARRCSELLSRRALRRVR
jgi:hypothetical protein